MHNHTAKKVRGGHISEQTQLKVIFSEYVQLEIIVQKGNRVAHLGAHIAQHHRANVEKHHGPSWTCSVQHHDELNLF